MYVCLTPTSWRGRDYQRGELVDAQPPRVPRGPSWACFSPHDALDLHEVDGPGRGGPADGVVVFLYEDSRGRHWELKTQIGKFDAHFERAPIEPVFPDIEAQAPNGELVTSNSRGYVRWAARTHPTKPPPRLQESPPETPDEGTSTEPTPEDTPEPESTPEDETSLDAPPEPEAPDDEPTYPTDIPPVSSLLTVRDATPAPGVSEEIQELIDEGGYTGPGGESLRAEKKRNAQQADANRNTVQDAPVAELAHTAETETPTELTAEALPDQEDAGEPGDDLGTDQDAPEDPAYEASGPPQCVEEPVQAPPAADMSEPRSVIEPRCKVCRHPDLSKINELLVSGVSFRNVAKRFPDLTPSAVYRHSKRHVGKHLAQAAEAREVKQMRDAAGLLEELHQSKDRVLTAMVNMEQLSDEERLRALPGLLACTREHCRIFELLLKAEVTRSLAEQEPGEVTQVVRIPAKADEIEWQRLARSMSKEPPPTVEEVKSRQLAGP